MNDMEIAAENARFKMDEIFDGASGNWTPELVSEWREQFRIAVLPKLIAARNSGREISDKDFEEYLIRQKPARIIPTKEQLQEENRKRYGTGGAA